VERGQGWEDFIITDLNRDLPRYAAECVAHEGGPYLQDGQLDLFRRAHHCAIMYGLIVDRIADGQLAAAADLLRLKRRFGVEWVEALAAALKSPQAAERLVRGALRELVAGNRRERRALAAAAAQPGSLSAIEYVGFTLQKLRWFGTSADAVFLVTPRSTHDGEFRRAYDTFSIALQCIDDALDAPTDLINRGASFPCALGMAPGGLMAAAPQLVRRAFEIAHDAGFGRFACWLARVARTLADRQIPGDPLDVGLSAALICSATEEVTNAD
jgi:hypothetical protein